MTETINYCNSCANCVYLKIVNKAPVYAECTLTERIFRLWQEDTRKHYCYKFEEKR